MKKIVGVEIKSGTFVGDDGKERSYNNATLKMVTDENKNCVGTDIMSYRITYDKLVEILGTQDIKNAINKEVVFVFSFKNDGTPYVSDINIK